MEIVVGVGNWSAKTGLQRVVMQNRVQCTLYGVKEYGHKVGAI